MRTPSLFSKLFAEFIGTLTLIAAGTGVALSVGAHADSAATLVAAALANGLAIGVMVTAIGHISGGHFNPSITFATMVTRRLKIAHGILYWIAQVAGGVVGALLIKAAFSSHFAVAALHGGTPGLAPHVSAGQGFLLEAMMAFFLNFVVFGVAIDTDGGFKNVRGMPIGLTITMGALMGGALTGGAMNPSRFLGPAIVWVQWDNWWVYVGGALAGAAVAGLSYMLLLRPKVATA